MTTELLQEPWVPSSEEEAFKKVLGHFKPKYHKKVVQVLAYLDKHSTDIIEKSHNLNLTCSNIEMTVQAFFKKPDTIILERLVGLIREYNSSLYTIGKQ